MLVPSPAQFYGFSKGINLLDRHIEWVYVPAVKDVTTEQLEGRANAFGRLVSRVVRSKFQFGEDIKQIRELAQDQYRTLLAKGASALDELSETLQSRVSQWAHPGAQVQLRWDHDQDKSVSVQEPLVRFPCRRRWGRVHRGSGALWARPAALLSASAAAGVICPGGNGRSNPDSGGGRAGTLPAPPQARHLASVLVDLSLKSAQLIVSTHSPLFVAGDTFEYVRVVRKDVTTGKSSIRHARYEAVAARLAAATLKQPKKRDGMIAIMHRSAAAESQRDVLCQSYRPARGHRGCRIHWGVSSPVWPLVGVQAARTAPRRHEWKKPATGTGRDRGGTGTPTSSSSLMRTDRPLSPNRRRQHMSATTRTFCGRWAFRIRIPFPPTRSGPPGTWSGQTACPRPSSMKSGPPLWQGSCASSRSGMGSGWGPKEEPPARRVYFGGRVGSRGTVDVP